MKFRSILFHLLSIRQLKNKKFTPLLHEIKPKSQIISLRSSIKCTFAWRFSAQKQSSPAIIMLQKTLSHLLSKPLIQATN